MLLDEIKHVAQTAQKKELYKFGLTIGIVLILGSTYFFLKSSSLFVYVFPPGLLLIVIALLRPQLLKYPYIGWMGMATVLGFFMTRVILTIVYTLIFVPIGIILKLLRKDLLNERWKPEVESYWIKRDQNSVDAASIENQY